jgi:hypothetical protein
VAVNKNKISITMTAHSGKSRTIFLAEKAPRSRASYRKLLFRAFSR